MAVKFTPNGFLDINTEPSDLPSELVGKSEVSGAMRRCTNLDLDSTGMAKTRKGSIILNATAISTAINTLLEHAGYRYTFAGTSLYKDETALSGTISNAFYSWIVYNAYTSITEAIFALCGASRLRIEGTTINNWGIAAPTIAPTVTGNITGHNFTYEWEGTQQLSSETVKAIITEAVQTIATGMVANPLYSWEEVMVNYQGPDIDPVRTVWSFERQTAYTNKASIGVKYTYVRKNGSVVECESNPSPATYIEADSGIWVSWTASTDSQVTHVRVYRTVDGGSTFYYAAEFAIGTIAGALTKSDTLLGAAVETDHDRPPAGSIVVGPDFNGYCFIAIGNLLYFCKAKQPEYWPALYYIEVSPIQYPIKALCMIGGQLYAMTDIEIYQIQGTGYNSFFPVPMKGITGAKSQESTYGVKGTGIYHIGNDGIYLYTTGGDNKISQERFDPIFRGEQIGGIPYINRTYIANCILKQFKNKLFFFYPAETNQFCTDLLVIDLTLNQKTVHYNYNDTSFRAVAIDFTNGKLIAGDTTGYIWELESLTNTDDNGTVIAWDIESKSFADQLYKYFPRYAKYDVELTGEAAATGKVLLDDVIKQSHTISSRNIRSRLITGCAGSRLGVRITGTGQAKIYMAEVE